jgi:hypothetical protein
MGLPAWASPIQSPDPIKWVDPIRPAQYSSPPDRKVDSVAHSDFLNKIKLGICED